MYESYPPIHDKEKARAIRWGMRAIIGIVILGLLTAASPVGVVNAGHRGVLVTLGKVGPDVFGEGLYFRVPFIQSVKEIPVRIVVMDVLASSYNKDNQTTEVTVALNYHLDPQYVNLMYRDIGMEWETIIIQPAIQESIKTVIAKYTSQELLDKRAQVKDEVKAEILTRIANRYIVVDEFAIKDLSFSDQFEAAIEAKQVAAQNALKAENDLERVQQEAQQRIEQAKAEAEAISIQAKAITQQGGRDYVQLKAIEKWNGILPAQMIPAGTVPFIDLN